MEAGEQLGVAAAGAGRKLRAQHVMKVSKQRSTARGAAEAALDGGSWSSQMLRLLGGPSQLLLDLLVAEAICALHTEGCGLGAPGCLREHLEPAAAG